MLLPILGTLSLLGAVYFLMPLAIGVHHIGMFWPAALLLLAAARCFFPGFFQRFPKWLKAILITGVSVVLAVAIAVLTVMSLAAADRPAEDDAPGTVVLLGCQVYNGKPSMMLQGRSEPVTEGACARRELIAMGIAPERIYAEEKSFDTRENLQFAAAIIRDNGLDTHVAIASDNFHQYRGQLFARQAGLTAQSAGCFSPWFLGPGYACREVVGILATWAGID